MERSTLTDYILRMLVVLIAILTVSGVINAGRTVYNTATNGTSIVCRNAKTLSAQAICPFDDAR